MLARQDITVRLLQAAPIKHLALPEHIQKPALQVAAHVLQDITALKVQVGQTEHQKYHVLREHTVRQAHLPQPLVQPAIGLMQNPQLALPNVRKDITVLNHQDLAIHIP